MLGLVCYLCNSSASVCCSQAFQNLKNCYTFFSQKMISLVGDWPSGKYQSVGVGSGVN